MGRRRPGSLIPLEVSILAACRDAGDAGSHGFALAKAIAIAGDTRELTATGTLYRALHRLEQAGLVESSWEDPVSAADAGRPRRRTYRLTGTGATALGASRDPRATLAVHSTSALDPRLAT